MIAATGDIVDRVVGEDGRCVVMVGQQVAVLSELSTVVLEAALDRETTLAELVSTVIDRLGPPPEARSAEETVAEAVAALRDLGAVADVSGS